MSESLENSAPQALVNYGTSIFYPIRIATVLGGLLVGFLYTYHFGKFGPYGYFVVLVGITYPHVMYFLQQRFESKRRIAHLTLLFDAGFAGCVIYLLSYSFQASLAMALISLVTPIALTGFSMLPWTSLALASGALVPAWVFGWPPPAEDFPLLDYLAGGYVLVFFALFANAVFARTRALQASRKELREQQLRTEIEKKRSEGLLGSILPPMAMAELRQSGAVGTHSRHCAICVVAIPDFERLQTGAIAEEQMEMVTEIWGSIDAICGRYGLETVNSTIDLHVAVGGLDRSSASLEDAGKASREIEEWLANFNRRRLFSGKPALASGIAVGFDELLIGAIQLRRLQFVVSGQALFDSIVAARRAAHRSDDKISV
ncbi:MAG: hypothetical protein K9J74_08855 [Sulfuritalea sp.]|nr:hypothetical protein [Sulfuritalea sp.]